MRNISRRRSARSAGVVCASLAALVLLASCGGSGPAATGVTHTVTMDGTGFVPRELTVNVGDKIVWKNQDPFPHTATSKEAGFDSKEIDEGESWSYTAEKAGDFNYVCTLHENMTGVLHVKQ
jgi:plastocyanin